MPDTIGSLAATHLADPAIAWSLGAFGAIAEFMWSPDEASVLRDDGLTRITPRGAIQIAGPDGATAIPYTTPSRDPARRQSGIAFCLPHGACGMAARKVVTEIGADSEALRHADRDAILFDMGLGLRQVDVMVRANDPETIAVLRAATGRSLFDPAQTLMMHLPRLSPHRVFTSRCGRIEVYQTIPAADGRSPDGPHTHVLPKLLKAGRTQAANIPIPDGLVPCLSIHLQKPDKDHVSRDLSLRAAIPQPKETEHDD